MLKSLKINKLINLNMYIKTCSETIESRRDGGGCLWLAEALCLWSWGKSRVKSTKCLCARCYCPLGEKLGIIGAGSGRWLMQLQHQRALFLSTNKETREEEVLPWVSIITTLIESALGKNDSLANLGCYMAVSANKQNCFHIHMQHLWENERMCNTSIWFYI